MLSPLKTHVFLLKGYFTGVTGEETLTKTPTGDAKNKATPCKQLSLLHSESRSKFGPSYGSDFEYGTDRLLVLQLQGKSLPYAMNSEFQQAVKSSLQFI